MYHGGNKLEMEEMATLQEPSETFPDYRHTKVSNSRAFRDEEDTARATTLIQQKAYGRAGRGK